MRPRIHDADGDLLTDAITVLIIEKRAQTITDLFRHLARKTPNPRKRHGDGVCVLASSYFQEPADFSDVLTALFWAFPSWLPP